MSTQVRSATATETQVATPVPLRLEVVTLPVADVDRAKSFYLSLGWRLDADISVGDDFRVVQVTPPQSQASVHFGTGLTAATPGSVSRLYLAVSDINAARDDLISRGAQVSEVYHHERRPGHIDEIDSRVTGPDAEHRTPRTHRSATRTATVGCSRRSPPGSRAENGRTDMEVAALVDLLHETAEHHGTFEAVAPPHNWWDWYAAYMHAREAGNSPDEAAVAAGHYMASVKHVVAPA